MAKFQHSAVSNNVLQPGFGHYQAKETRQADAHIVLLHPPSVECE